MSQLSDIAQLAAAGNGTDTTPTHVGGNGVQVVVWLACTVLFFYGFHRCADYHTHPQRYNNDDGSKRWHAIFCGHNLLTRPELDVEAAAGATVETGSEYVPPLVRLSSMG
ncbi:MAG: hypothetical protein P1U34_10965 [Coxiellaceae bacterium]|nr:hypothetical protein [Coxiellaceae bacterium]